jgi:hypothetical protein
MLDGAFTRNVAFSTLNPASAVGSAAEAAARKKIATRTTRRVRGVVAVGGGDDDVLGDAARSRRGAISRSRANAKRDAGRRTSEGGSERPRARPSREEGRFRTDDRTVCVLFFFFQDLKQREFCSAQLAADRSSSAHPAEARDSRATMEDTRARRERTR